MPDQYVTLGGHAVCYPVALEWYHECPPGSSFRQRSWMRVRIPPHDTEEVPGRSRRRVETTFMEMVCLLAA